MHERRILRESLFVALVLATLMVGTIWAETRTQSNVTGSTYHYLDGWRAYTSSTFVQPYIYVNLRAWGSPPNPLKDEQSNAKYNAAKTDTVQVADIYPVESTQNLVNTPYNTITFYTSGDEWGGNGGCFSSYSWWSSGSGTRTC